MIIYGTLQECTNELFEMIDFDNADFPDFDFAASVSEDCENEDDAYEEAEGWFGVKDLGENFDCDTISLMCAHYGGGGIRALELSYDSDEVDQKNDFMRMIGESTDEIGYGVLEPNDYTVFEIIKEKGE